MKYISTLEEFDKVQEQLNTLEKLMALKLLQNEIKFIPQYTIKIPIYFPVNYVDIRKFFVADFLLENNIIIETDGKLHMEEENYIRDRKKDNILTAMGYRVFRFSHKEVFDTDDTIIYVIKNLIIK